MTKAKLAGTLFLLVLMFLMFLDVPVIADQDSYSQPILLTQ